MVHDDTSIQILGFTFTDTVLVAELVQGLIQSADDSNKQVQEAISNALLKIGKEQVNLVLSSCLNYIATGSNVSILLNIFILGYNIVFIC